MEELTRRDHLEFTLELFVDAFLYDEGDVVTDANGAAADWQKFITWLQENKDAEFGPPV